MDINRCIEKASPIHLNLKYVIVFFYKINIRFVLASTAHLSMQVAVSTGLCTYVGVGKRNEENMQDWETCRDIEKAKFKMLCKQNKKCIDVVKTK